MKKFRVVCLGVILAGAFQTVAQAMDCDSIQVHILNYTMGKITGEVSGTSGNLGSSAFYVENTLPITGVGVTAQDNPGGAFLLRTVIQSFNNTPVNVVCEAKVDDAPGGCPDPAVQPLTLSIVGTSVPALSCSFQHHPVAAQPAPPQVDSDGDGRSDINDNCPYVWNPDQKDLNDNHIGDACETQEGSVGEQ